MLQDKKRAAFIWVPLLAIVTVVLLALLSVLHTLYFLIALPTFSLFTAISGYGALRTYRALARDVREGQKKLITGPVEAQNVDVSRTKDRNGVESSATYRFWIKVSGQKITVTEEQYYQFKKGDLAEAFIAPNSEIVFSVNKPHLQRPFA